MMLRNLPSYQARQLVLVRVTLRQSSLPEYRISPQYVQISTALFRNA